MGCPFSSSRRSARQVSRNRVCLKPQNCRVADVVLSRWTRGLWCTEHRDLPAVTRPQCRRIETRRNFPLTFTIARTIPLGGRGVLSCVSTAWEVWAPRLQVDSCLSWSCFCAGSWPGGLGGSRGRRGASLRGRSHEGETLVSIVCLDVSAEVFDLLNFLLYYVCENFAKRHLFSNFVCFRQYLAVVFKDKPLELWDVRTCTILREMSKNFPGITALVSCTLRTKPFI